MTPGLRGELYRLLLRHRVLFFRDQHLSTPQHIAFAEAFGTILIFNSVAPADPEHPEVHDIHGSTADWHIDASGTIEPPVATILRAVKIPAAGGDTIWANGVAAYQGLPDALKKRLEGKYVTHNAPDTEHAIVAHPLVRTHPDTGERHLYINFAPWVDPLILGMSRPDSDVIVNELRCEYLRPEYQVRFRWSPGTIAIWDNRVVQHTGTRDYDDADLRHMKRLCIARFL
jgi:taurine dioxygenase